MIPETRGRHNKKYDFEHLKIGSYVIADRYSKAISYRASAYKRGFRVAIRDIDGEIRAYFMGQR